MGVGESPVGRLRPVMIAREARVSDGASSQPRRRRETESVDGIPVLDSRGTWRIAAPPRESTQSVTTANRHPSCGTLAAACESRDRRRRIRSACHDSTRVLPLRVGSGTTESRVGRGAIRLRTPGSSRGFRWSQCSLFVNQPQRDLHAGSWAARGFRVSPRTLHAICTVTARALRGEGCLMAPGWHSGRRGAHATSA